MLQHNRHFSLVPKHLFKLKVFVMFDIIEFHYMQLLYFTFCLLQTFYRSKYFFNNKKQKVKITQSKLVAKFQMGNLERFLFHSSRKT